MMKKNNWLSKLKIFFFTSERSSTQEKEKKRKWFFRGPKIKELASVIPPPLPLPLPLPSPPHEKAHDETDNLQRPIDELAAIKIQAAFRRHLARKALRALKGLVKLQAIIRGRNVRQKTINTLHCLQSIVNIQTRVCARRSQSFEENFDFHETATKIESSNHIRWDDKIFITEESNAFMLSNKKPSEKLRPWLEEWADKQMAKMEEGKSSTSLMSNNLMSKDLGTKKIHYSTNNQKHLLEGLVSPKYMAPTESAKARARSVTSRRGIRTLSFDAYSEGNSSPYKNKLVSDISSSVVTSEKASNYSSGRSSMRSDCDGLHCKSPSLKGISGAVKSRRRGKDVSFDSECSMLNWDRYGLFK